MAIRRRWAMAGAALAFALAAPSETFAKPPVVSDALRDWSPCLGEVGVSFEPGAGPWRLVAAALEPDSDAPLCGAAAFCPGSPLSGGAGSIVFRFLDETGARLCPPEVRGKVLSADGGVETLEGCESTPEGPIQRFSMLGTGYDACNGGRGGFAATVDEAANGGPAADRVTGLGLPNGRPVNVVLTWRRNPPPEVAGRQPAGLCSIQITTQCPLPAGQVGQPYNTMIQRLGGSFNTGGNLIIGQWDVQPSLPPGLGLASGPAGQIGTMFVTGVPTQAGDYNFTLSVRDSSDPTCSTSKACSLSIALEPGGLPTTTPPQYLTAGNNQRETYTSGGPDDSAPSGSHHGGCTASAAGAPSGGLLWPGLLLLAAAVALPARIRAEIHRCQGRLADGGVDVP